MLSKCISIYLSTYTARKYEYTVHKKNRHALIKCIFFDDAEYPIFICIMNPQIISILNYESLYSHSV